MFMREDNHLAFVDFDNKPHTYAELMSNIKRFQVYMMNLTEKIY